MIITYCEVESMCNSCGKGVDRMCEKPTYTPTKVVGVRLATSWGWFTNILSTGWRGGRGGGNTGRRRLTESVEGVREGRRCVGIDKRCPAPARDGRRSSPREGQRGGEAWKPKTDGVAADPEGGPTEARQNRERKERPSPQGSCRHKRGSIRKDQKGGAAWRMPPRGWRGQGDAGPLELGRQKAGPNDRSEPRGSDTRPAGDGSDGER